MHYLIRSTVPNSQRTGSAFCRPVLVLLAIFFCASSPPAFGQVELEDRNGDGEVRILAFGDSITFGIGDGFDPSQYVERPEIIPGVFGYPGRVETFLSVLVDNRGVPGETVVSEGVVRFQSELVQNQSDYVLIMEGANDAVFQESPTNVRAKLQAMVNVARALGVEPILLTLTPTCCDRPGVLPFLYAYSSQIRELGATNDVTVVDVEVAFQEACPDLDECTLLNRPEGLHPNTSGYDLIGKIVAEAILGEPLEEDSPESEMGAEMEDAQ
ncbi:MAG: SGNH/GDSL hydrolase family protein [Bdellovibrionales bacterium]|nr:SGNH/GDSL hydrolase family protein [Bdellovibrionales bacterium]